MKILILLIFFRIANAAKKNFSIEFFVDCPGRDLPLSIQIKVNSSLNKANKIWADGYLEAKEKVNGPFEMIFEINRCDLANQNCEVYSKLKVKRLSRSRKSDRRRSQICDRWSEFVSLGDCRDINFNF